MYLDSGRGAGEEALCGQGAAQPETEVEAEAHGGLSPHGHGELQRGVQRLCGKFAMPEIESAHPEVEIETEAHGARFARVRNFRYSQFKYNGSITTTHVGGT